MSDRREHLRVLIADQSPDRLTRVGALVAELGHEVVARQTQISDVGAVTAANYPTSHWSDSATARSTRSR